LEELLIRLKKGLKSGQATVVLIEPAWHTVVAQPLHETGLSHKRLFREAVVTERWLTPTVPKVMTSVPQSIQDITCFECISRQGAGKLDTNYIKRVQFFRRKLNEGGYLFVCFCCCCCCCCLFVFQSQWK